MQLLSENSVFSTGQCATLACLLEVSAPKPGNVHRGADFEDLTFYDFATSAVAIGPAMEAAVERTVGQTVLAAIQATRSAVGTNVNLGTVLLLAPLAAVPRNEPLDGGVQAVLAGLGPEDARDVYQAIRLAQPSGLGRVQDHDVSGDPPDNLLDAMRLAAVRDMIARQYAEGFRQVLHVALPWLREGLDRGWSLPDAIVRTQMHLMAEFPDSLIARKCGPQIARQSAEIAAAVLRSGVPGEETYHGALADFDFWLRSDGHRRNPGTTADLIAAALFCLLRDPKPV